MRKVWLIAKRELIYFFSSWSGYVIMAVCLFISGILFNAFSLTATPRLSSEVLEQFFYQTSGVAMIAALLLSMRLISEERSNSTIMLLYTSPVTETQIILGKYISALLFFIILQLISVYMPALIFVNGKVSIAHIITGYLGIILLGSAIISIGLFASCLCSSQLLSGVLGAVMVVVFLVFWMLSSIVDPPFKDVFMYLAIHNNHFLPFQRGTISIAHVVFYVCVNFFFIECSLKTLESRRCRG